MNCVLPLLQTRLMEAEDALQTTKGELATARIKLSDSQTLIAHLKLTVAKMQRDRFGPKSERTARLLDQMELQLEELEANVTEDDHAAEQASADAAGMSNVNPYERKKPVKKPFL